jgi:hypothetical protein
VKVFEKQKPARTLIVCVICFSQHNIGFIMEYQARRFLFREEEKPV